MYDFFPSETAFDSEQLDFNPSNLDKTKYLLWKFTCVCQITLKPRFLGSSFFKKHTESAFDSEKSDFHLRIGLNQRAVVKLYFQKKHNHKSFTFMVFLMSWTTSSSFLSSFVCKMGGYKLSKYMISFLHELKK